MREKKTAVVFSNREKAAVSIEGTSKVSRNSRKKHLVFGREREEEEEEDFSGGDARGTWN